jgi:hypothetical protein
MRIADKDPPSIENSFQLVLEYTRVGVERVVDTVIMDEFIVL